ncbi:MAG TPA: DUF4760 domain-containing protein [Candidatus Baltobacteraceae bacterium]|jgi:hypothetical protein
MSPEGLTAIASFLTLIVVAASAAAALIQLRHMRGANQIIALNEIRETFETDRFRDAVRYVYRELPRLYEDAAARADLVAVPLPAQYEPARTVANFFENVGMYVKRGVLDENFTADMWGGIILTSWLRMTPMITNRRRVQEQPDIWQNFEYLAVICQQFKERYPNGNYPKAVPRMPEAEVWQEAGL